MTASLDLDQLRADMEAGTPGPWTRLAGKHTFQGSIEPNVCDFGDSETYYPTEGTPPNDTDFRRILRVPDLESRVLSDAARLAALAAALKRHHQWHLEQDRDGAAWGVDPVDAYSESGLAEQTIAALAAYRATEGKP